MRKDGEKMINGITEESTAKVNKAVKAILDVFRMAKDEFSEEEQILFAYAINKAFSEEGIV